MKQNMRRQGQLPLEVQLRDEATFANFLSPDANRAAVDTLRRQGEPGGEPVIFLHGATGSGKSHLLQAACHRTGGGALYLPLAELAPYSPDDVLQGVEFMDLVCFDDLQAVAGNAQWEAALFNFYNRARQQECLLQLAATVAPRQLPLSLADLQSRLSWAVVFQLVQASDDEKAEILCFRAGRRGLSMSSDVAAYIVHRARRGMDELLGLLDTLDRASLAEQRSLSIPFVKKTLGW